MTNYKNHFISSIRKKRIVAKTPFPASLREARSRVFGLHGAAVRVSLTRAQIRPLEYCKGLTRRQSIGRQSQSTPTRHWFSTRCILANVTAHIKEDKDRNPKLADYLWPRQVPFSVETARPMLRSRPNLKAVFSRLTVKLRDPSIYTHPGPMESARGQGSDRQPKVAREPLGSRSGTGR